MSSGEVTWISRRSCVDCSSSGYSGDFTVEYEGPFDGTLRLYESVERARKVAGEIFG